MGVAYVFALRAACQRVVRRLLGLGPFSAGFAGFLLLVLRFRVVVLVVGVRVAQAERQRGGQAVEAVEVVVAVRVVDRALRGPGTNR